MYRLEYRVESQEKQVSVAERSSKKLNLASKEGSIESWPDEDYGFKKYDNRYRYDWYWKAGFQRSLC